MTRPTGRAAYGDGTTIPKATPRITDGAHLASHQTIKADACVIGSGAGGAAVAKELAEGGMTVVMLEEGGHHTTDDFAARPRAMTAQLYRDAGMTTTVGNTPIILPLGRGVGGTTTINSGTCFRTPPPVLEMWRERFGLDQLTADELDPYFRRVERTINVAQVPPELAGRNAHVVKRGADSLGWSNDFIYRNVRGCIGSGVCAFGCPTSAKQSANLSYVPLAWNAGATTYTHTRATHVELARNRARAVTAHTAGGARLRIETPTVIVACGAIHTPLFLRRNGLGAPSGELGHNLAVHPATGVRALFEEEIDMARGVPQSLYIDEFADDRIMFEGAAGPPDYLAMTMPFSRERHRDLMLRFRNMSQFGVMVSDLSRGHVRERFGRPEIRYDVNPDDVAAFKRGIELLCDLYWEAGAAKVFPPVDRIGELTNGDTGPLRDADLKAHDLMLMAFHPLGTARADARPAHGVVDGDLKLHDAGGIYVADGSVVPSSLGVNPQITIMALASRLAYRLLDKRPPRDEPEPESIARPRIEQAHTITA